ncbi:hypothetical protein OF829_02800 [Sphingomonas sp. LB-2]|uniref:hypothetical protein n=1 Tax=Sphingomonas caeni TaxID=2984949 RepID=UPI00222F97B2|nr:hypothetical protein [Sphingomonas caeni]MCW3846151.1 hypothetical protein [Sphingomonas caeni]
MHARSIAALLALLLIPAAAAAQEAPMGQMILDNGSSMSADLYVDGDFACAAPAHSSCTADVTAGFHIAFIVFADGDYIISDTIDVPGEMSITLPVRDLMF